MNVCIIPARGGSKRIPGKNVRLFCGKPMIAHSIEAARESALFDRIIVSTDSEEIAAVARPFGAEVPFLRPAELSDDRATTEEVFLHALQWLAVQDRSPRFACLLYATAPFVRPDCLCRGLEALQYSGAPVAFSVTTFAFPVFRALKVNAAGRVEMFWPEYRTARSQDLPEAFHDAGQFYWVDTRSFLENPRLYASGAVPVVLPRHLVQDIDTEEDWTRAELMFQVLRNPS